MADALEEEEEEEEEEEGEGEGEGEVAVAVAEGLPLAEAEAVAEAVEEAELVGSDRDVSGVEDGDSVASVLASTEVVGSGVDPLNALHPVRRREPPMSVPSRTFFIFHPFTRTMIDQTVADVMPGEGD